MIQEDDSRLQAPGHYAAPILWAFLAAGFWTGFLAGLIILGTRHWAH